MHVMAADKAGALRDSYFFFFKEILPFVSLSVIVICPTTTTVYSTSDLTYYLVLYIWLHTTSTGRTPRLKRGQPGQEVHFM